MSTSAATVVGLPTRIVRCSRTIPETEAIVMFGEIGTSRRSRSRFIAKKIVTKPLVAYIAARGAEGDALLPRRPSSRGIGEHEGKSKPLRRLAPRSSTRSTICRGDTPILKNRA